MLAVKEGRDDLAKQALVRHQEHGERAAAIDNTWRAQSAETEKLKGSLRQLNEKIEEARRKRNLLIAKQKRAQAQRRIHETMSGLSDASAFDAFNRMAEKIEESERRTVALTEVDEALQLPDIEREFLQLEAGKGGADMDDRLVALKQQMGVLPPPAPNEEPRQLGAGTMQGAGNVQDGQVEIEEDEGGAGSTDTVAEADLLRQFESLEQRESR
jgi:phage shock protein A